MTEVATSRIEKLVAMISGRERWALALGVGLQLAVLGGMIAMRVAILITGEVYFVRVQPVDPRDLMRGDYVILSYEFSRLPSDHRVDFINMNRQGMFPEKLRGQPIYVTLAPEMDGKHWHATRFSMRKPDQGPFLMGTMTEFGQVSFGIEQYFVQEGKGLQYEASMRSGQLSAEISLTREGKAAVRKLHIVNK